jgi:CDGSH-type Zn-finger protein
LSVPRITVTKDGPYEVEGAIPLAKEIIAANEAGESWEWRHGQPYEVPDLYRLCRCGATRTPPFCDGSEERIGFDGTEVAGRIPYLEQAEVVAGPHVTLTDAPRLCARARFCMARGDIWHRVADRNPASAGVARRQAAYCPSGRLATWSTDPSGRLAPDGEPDLEPSIGLVEDPGMGLSGPIWVWGGIPVFSADGIRYETMNRRTLCRCGASRNKPFCDGSHVRVRFTDQAVQP